MMIQPQIKSFQLGIKQVLVIRFVNSHHIPLTWSDLAQQICLNASFRTL